MSDELKAAIETGLKDVSAQLDAKMAEHTKQTQELGKANTELTGQIDKLSSQYKEMETQLIELAQRTTGFKGQEDVVLSFGDRFIASDEFKSVASGNAQKSRLELKGTGDPTAVISDTSTTLATQRTGVIGGLFKPLTIRQLLTEIPVTTSSVEGIAEDTWTNNAAETPQIAVKPESLIDFKQVTTNIKTVAHWVKVSNQLLADAPAVAAYINTRLLDGLAQRVDRQLILGNGGNNLDGLTKAGNFTAYTAGTGDNLADAVSRAKWSLWAKGATPDVVIVNPEDWGDVERMRSTDGHYLFGVPGTVAPQSLFNVPTVVSSHVPKGKFIVGSLRDSALIYARQAKTIELGYVNDDFTRNLVTIRAEERLALAVDRPSAILYGDFSQ